MNQHSEIRSVVRRSNAMRKYGAWILVAAVFCAILAVTPRTAHACSCGFLPLSEYAEDVELAFAGHQLKRIIPTSNEEAFKPWSVTLVFQVDRVYKGRAGPQVELRTNLLSEACGLDLSGAGVTGIAAFRTKEDLEVNRCASPVTIAELEEVFGEGYPADPKAEAWGPIEEGPIRMLIVAGAMVILGGGAVVFLKRRRTQE